MRAAKQRGRLGALRLAVALIFVGCAADGGVQCRVGADCMSGVCQVDGTCASALPDAGPDGRVPEGGVDDGGDGSMDAVDAPLGDARVDAGGVCSPNRDGRIDQREIPLRAGLRAIFRSTTNVDVDTRGEVLGDGTRRWDFSGALPRDADVLVETIPLDGAWYADDFTGADYVSRLSQDSDLLGVFEIGADALQLRGVVSPEEGFMRTNLENDPPVDALRFPLELGSTWTSEVAVSGLAQGVFSSYSETYTSRVDAAGTLSSPFGEHSVLRVRTVLERTIGFARTTTVSFSFVSECFGTVATLVGDTGDDGAELDHVAEIRRLAP